jgi:hypothetical protein
VIIVGWGLDALRLYRHVLWQTDGATPLYVASERGRLSVVVALLDAGAALTVRVCEGVGSKLLWRIVHCCR